MPIYDYHCTDCGHSFEELTAFDKLPECSSCGGEHAERQFSFGGVVGQPQESAAVAEAETDEVAEQHDEPHLGSSETLRCRDERAWDLERDFERRHAAQLDEISAKSIRVSELMAQIEQLEPLLAENNALETQLAEVFESHQRLEVTERTLTADLAQRATELKAAETHAQELHSQISAAAHAAGNAQAESEEQVRVRDHQIENLSHELEELKGDLESRTAALFKRDEMIQAADETVAHLTEQVREHDRSLAEAHEAHATLAEQLSSTDAQLNEQLNGKTELERALVGVEAELQAVRNELNQTSGALQSTQREKGEIQNAYASATGEVEHHRAKFLASVRHLSATQSVIEELAPMLRSLETTLGGGATRDTGDHADTGDSGGHEDSGAA